MTSTFKVKTSNSFISSNRAQANVTGHINNQSVGISGGFIPPSSVLNNTIVISPSVANLTYTLPTAAQIIKMHGISPAGLPNLAVGNSHSINVTNKGTFPAYIACHQTGGDGTALIIYNSTSNNNYTGSTVPSGLSSVMNLEWTAINSGYAGVTGAYTIYSGQGNVGATGPVGSTGNTGAAGAVGVTGATGGTLSYGFFYGLTAGTDNPGATQYAATIAAGVPINFPNAGPTAGGVAINNPGSGVVQTNNTKFTLANIGTYEVKFYVQTTEPGQFEADIGDGTTQSIILGSCGANQTPTAGGHPITQTFYVTTASTNRVLRIINPAGNPTALTITPTDASVTHANSPTLSIKQIA